MKATSLLRILSSWRRLQPAASALVPTLVLRATRDTRVDTSFDSAGKSACATSAILVLLGAAALSAATTPNIVLILTDDQGWTGTSVQLDPNVPDSKSDFYRTPALERLAREGMRFTNAYAPHPNCSPTRLAIQTGKSPAQLRMTDIIGRNSGRFYEGHALIPPQHINNLPSEEITIAELIKSAKPEYATAHFGKWHLAGGGPGNHGYDEHDGATSNRDGNRKIPGNPKRIAGVTKRANEFLTRMAEAKRPFFLQISHYAVHLGIENNSETLQKYLSGERGLRHNHPGHAAMTENLDSGIGAVLDQLDKLDLASNTFVIMTSDNGSYLHAGKVQVTTNKPLHGQKASCWEGGIRVPMFIRGSGIKGGSVSDIPVIGTDLYPTIRELLGIEAPLPNGVEGGSLVPLLKTNGKASVRRPHDDLYWHFPHYQTLKGTTPMSAIRSGDYKLIKFYESGESKLFHLGEDLGESRDLSGTLPVVTQRLEQKLVSYLMAVSAPMPRPNPAGSEYKPVEGQLLTRWAKEVSPENALPEYPRPQMVRPLWQNLNGLWDYDILPRGVDEPTSYDGKILVPFAAESALSGVKKPVTPSQRLWYKRTFRVPEDWQGNRVLLHFGAVDWHTVVRVNGQLVGEHRGGYDPFTFDITDALNGLGLNTLVVGVWDPTNTGTQARGKQVLEPRGIWYTAVTGIWQTVWLEPVPAISIARLHNVPDIDRSALRLRVTTRGFAGGHTIRAEATRDGRRVGEASGDADSEIEIPIPEARFWSPDSPNLYDLRVTLLQDGKPVDRVTSYFGMRKISLGKDSRGNLRLMLNNEPQFQLGPLDQGWWPDGLYTAPTDEALRYDIEVTKQLGFNMARKHVKVEPARWYYWCDKLGLLVWQDMPSGYLGGRGPTSLFVGALDEHDAVRDGVSAAQFEIELKALIDNFSQFPSIVAWVPFNEGWGQYDAARIAGWVKQYDPSRLVNATSGWTDRGVGDMYDTHMYPGPGMEDAGPNRATVLGEFGGLGWPVPDHLWWNKRNWGYRTYQSREELNAKYDEVVGNVYGLLGFGLSAAIYTQTTDVEGEVNGLMTYDREITKLDPANLKAIHDRLYDGTPRASILIATSEDDPQQWAYTNSPPPASWTTPDFDASAWQQGNAPFQSGTMGHFPTGVKWDRGQLWARRDFTLNAAPDNLWMIVMHDVTRGAVYLNGQEVLRLDGTRPTGRHYRHLDLSQYAGALRSGKNVIALHGDKDEGSRGLDAGLYMLE